MTGKQLRKLLEENGWCLDRISGSHHIMIREGNRSVPIPIHGNSDLPSPDKQDKCVNEVILCQKIAENNF